MQALTLGQRAQASRPTGLEAYIPFQAKREEAVRLLSRYLPEHKAAHEVGQIAQLLQGEKKRNITIIELVEFHRMLEACLAGSIGAASAKSRKVVKGTNDLMVFGSRPAGLGAGVEGR